MATLQVRNGSYRVLFCYRGRRHGFTLGRVDRREAELAAANVERILLRVDQGLLSVPQGERIVEFVRRDGRPAPPGVAPVRDSPLALGQLRDRYLETHGNGAVEASTLKTARTHLDHLVATLGESYPLPELRAADLQRHIDRRAKSKGRGGRPLSPATIRKELAGFRSAFHWAVHAGLTAGSFPNKGLVFPKADEKPPFQTLGEVERRIEAGGLTTREEDELWESLYLTLPEVEELLDYARGRANHPWIFPMVCTAAHSNARRSELLRMRTADVDLSGGTLLVRERKKTRGTRTSRRVPLSPTLTGVLGDWLKSHPGGPYLFCQEPGCPGSRSKRRATSPVTRDEAHDHFRRTLAGSRWRVVRGWHVLRHSFASNCVAGGVDQRLIDEWMGHTTEAMRRRYRHLTPDLQQQAIRSVFR